LKRVLGSGGASGKRNDKRPNRQEPRLKKKKNLPKKEKCTTWNMERGKQPGPICKKFAHREGQGERVLSKNEKKKHPNGGTSRHGVECGGKKTKP